MDKYSVSSSFMRDRGDLIKDEVYAKNGRAIIYAYGVMDLLSKTKNGFIGYFQWLCSKGKITAETNVQLKSVFVGSQSLEACTLKTCAYMAIAEYRKNEDPQSLQKLAEYLYGQKRFNKIRNAAKGNRNDFNKYIIEPLFKMRNELTRDSERQIGVGSKHFDDIFLLLTFNTMNTCMKDIIDSLTACMRMPSELKGLLDVTSPVQDEADELNDARDALLGELADRVCEENESLTDFIYRMLTEGGDRVDERPLFETKLKYAVTGPYYLTKDEVFDEIAIDAAMRTAHAYVAAYQGDFLAEEGEKAIAEMAASGNKSMKHKMNAYISGKIKTTDFNRLVADIAGMVFFGAVERNAKTRTLADIRISIEDSKDSFDELKKKIRGLEKELKTVKRQNTKKIKELQSNAAKAEKRADEALKKLSEKKEDPRIAEMDAELRSEKKKRIKAEDEASLLRSQIEALREENAAIRKARASGEKAPEETIDANARYLFIVDEDAMKPKLMEWFPNSILSESSSVTAKSSRNIDLAVFLCAQVTHKEYYRIKYQCEKFGVPFVHCSYSSYPRICQAIAEAKAKFGNRVPENKA